MLITAKDLAERDGKQSVAEWILWLAQRAMERGRFHVMWDGEHVGGAPVMAFVDFGRWCTRCECGQHAYADPDEPVMFCARCGNGNTGLARPVIFPPEGVRQEIERLLLERPVTENPLAKDKIESARLAKPVYPFLLRSWYPGQSVEDLIAINSMIGGQ